MLKKNIVIVVNIVVIVVIANVVVVVIVVIAKIPAGNLSNVHYRRDRCPLDASRVPRLWAMPKLN